MKVVEARDAVRLVHAGHVISEVRREAGPTDSVFDVLATAIDVLSPGPVVALLGFAAGGILAPLRALGGSHRIDGVDLDGRGHALFLKHAAFWAGPVRFTLGDAVRFLPARPRYHAVLEDLSQQVLGDAVKPDVCFGPLPGRIRRSLLPGGVALFNLVLTPGRTWSSMYAALSEGHRDARVIVLDEWENRVLLCGERLPPPRELGRSLRGRLAAIGSELCTGLKVAQLRPGAL